VLSKVVALQAQMGQDLSLSEKLHIFKERPDFVCLPEYFALEESVPSYRRASKRIKEHLERLCRLSDELSTCLIAGTVVESDGDLLYNTCYVIYKGLALGRYHKRFPDSDEINRGISTGNDKLILDVEGVRIGIMVCGDVHHPGLYDEQRDERTDIVFIPTLSPLLPADSISLKKQRDRKYCLALAERTGAYVVKACGVGEHFGRRLQGSSLIAAPWGILRRVNFESESHIRVLSETLDMTELREFRDKQDRSILRASSTMSRSYRLLAG